MKQKKYIIGTKYESDEVLFSISVKTLKVIDNIERIYKEALKHGYILHPDFHFGTRKGGNDKWSETLTFYPSLNKEGKGRAGDAFFSVIAYFIINNT